MINASEVVKALKALRRNNPESFKHHLLLVSNSLLEIVAGVVSDHDDNDERYPCKVCQAVKSLKHDLRNIV